MGLKYRLHAAAWSCIPTSLVQPREGSRTGEGMILTKRPSLSTPDATKFAVFSDTRFYMRRLYDKFIQFLPEEFECVGEPNGQNCYMYTLGIDPSAEEFLSKEFIATLDERAYETIPYSKTTPQPGDIVEYCVANVMGDLRTRHAALYLGNGRVRARWGMNSPLIEHPLEEVIPDYWDKNPECLLINRK